MASRDTAIWSEAHSGNTDAGEIDGVAAVESHKSVAPKKGKEPTQKAHVLQGP